MRPSGAFGRPVKPERTFFGSQDDSTGLVNPTTNVRATSPPCPHTGKPTAHFQDLAGNRIARGMLPTVNTARVPLARPRKPRVGRFGSYARLTVPSLRRRLSMKWNIILSTIVLGLATCSQGFGFE